MYSSMWMGEKWVLILCKHKEITQGNYLYSGDDPANAEYVVLVDWVKTVPEAQAVKEIGFFGNQNSVCRPRDQRWVYTVERLKKVWGIDS